MREKVHLSVPRLRPCDKTNEKKMERECERASKQASKSVSESVHLMCCWNHLPCTQPCNNICTSLHCCFVWCYFGICLLACLFVGFNFFRFTLTVTALIRNKLTILFTYRNRFVRLLASLPYKHTTVVCWEQTQCTLRLDHISPLHTYQANPLKGNGRKEEKKIV